MTLPLCKSTASHGPLLKGVFGRRFECLGLLYSCFVGTDVQYLLLSPQVNLYYYYFRPIIGKAL